MIKVSLKNIKKVYDKNVVAVHDFNLDIEDKEFIVLVGPSGCGKSTTLRMIAGLEEISGGELYINEKLVNDVAPKDRDIAMVFQNYALYPHMTVYENMAFALKLRKVKKDVIDQKVKEAAEIDGATGLKQVRYITLPLLRNVLITCLTLSITGALKVFDMPWVMFPPYFSDAYLTGTYMYYQTFQTSNVDYAAAIAVIIVVLGVVLSQLSKLVFREKDY